MSQNISLGTLPFLDVFGLHIAWASTTTLTMAAGQARDANNVADLVLSEAVTIDGATNGANGLDTGDLENATWYYIYLIGSSLNYKRSAALLSKSATPLMPEGYDSIRKIGWTLTDGSAHFLKVYIYGNSNSRKYFWDVKMLELNAQGSTSFAAVDMATSVAPSSNIVMINYTLVPATAGNSAFLRVTGSTATDGSIELVAPVVSAAFIGQVIMNCSNAQSIDYKTDSASDDLSINVTGFEDFI